MTLILSHNCPLSIWQAERIFDHPGWTRFDSVVYPLHLHSRSAALHQATTWPRNSRKRMIAPKPGPASLILALKRTEQRVLWLSVWCVTLLQIWAQLRFPSRNRPSARQRICVPRLSTTLPVLSGLNEEQLTNHGGALRDCRVF